MRNPVLGIELQVRSVGQSESVLQTLPRPPFSSGPPSPVPPAPDQPPYPPESEAPAPNRKPPSASNHLAGRSAGRRKRLRVVAPATSRGKQDRGQQPAVFGPFIPVCSVRFDTGVSVSRTAAQIDRRRVDFARRSPAVVGPHGHERITR